MRATTAQQRSAARERRLGVLVILCSGAAGSAGEGPARVLRCVEHRRCHHHCARATSGAGRRRRRAADRPAGETGAPRPTRQPPPRDRGAAVTRPDSWEPVRTNCCSATWQGLNTCHCSACYETFTTVRAARSTNGLAISNAHYSEPEQRRAGALYNWQISFCTTAE